MNTNPTLKEKLRHEARSFAIIFLYVWAILSLFALHKAFILERNPLSGQVLAIINAVILAKVIVVLEFFKIGEFLPGHPPIFRICLKSVVFGLVLLVVHLLEEEIKGWLHGKTFSQTLAGIDGGRLIEMGSLAIMMVVALWPYNVLREIGRTIGEKKLLGILFHPPAANTPPQGE